MKPRPAQRDPAKALAWGIFPQGAPSLLKDLPIFLAAFSVFYAFLAVTRYWLTPVSSQTEIDLRPGALPAYAMFSVMRIAIAYVISLVFSIVYGYVAAYNAKAERVMIPLLDTLQSIPVLSFLPGVMLAMVALFPSRQFGMELGSILLVFSGQAWNMAFSFYSSLKSIPREMHEVAEVYRWSPWQRLVQMELPFAAIGLVWNSMISVASAWFYLIACEMFVLRDTRFPPPRARILPANGGKRRGHASDRLGLDRDDRRNRRDGPAHLAPGHCLGREIQVRTGGGRAGPALARSRFAEKLAGAAADGPRVRQSGPRDASVCTSPGRGRTIAKIIGRASRPGGSLMRSGLLSYLASLMPS